MMLVKTNGLVIDCLANAVMDDEERARQVDNKAVCYEKDVSHLPRPYGNYFIEVT